MRRTAMYPAPATPRHRARPAYTPWLGLTALLFTLSPLLGCAATDSAPRTAAAQTVAGTDNLDPVKLRDMGMAVRWLYQVDLAGSGGVTDVEVLDDLLVAVEGPANVVTAIRLRDGQKQWKTILGLDLESLFRPLRKDDRIFVNSAARFFTLDARNGERIGVADLDAPVTAGGVLIGDFAIFGAAAGTIFAHEIDAGYAMWRYKMPGRLVAPPVASGDDVFVGDEAGTYAMLDADTGDLVFRNRVFDSIVASATVHRGDILIPSLDRSLYALNRATGNDSWVYRATEPLRTPPLSVGRDIYLSASVGGLIALNSDGSVNWESELEAVPVLATDRGLYAIAHNALLLIDPDSGEVLDGVRVNGVTKGVPGPDGSLILQTKAGRFVRLDPVR